MRKRRRTTTLAAPAITGGSTRTRSRRRGCVAAAALVAVLGGAVVSSPAAAQDTGGASDAEVRIVARKLENGRIEFGLQQHQTNNTWGDRQLPRVRFFPTTATVDRWLASSPLDLSVGDVRIVARKLENGRIEFGLQQHQPDDTWGDRQLPRVRFFPTTATVDRWLRSSPVLVTAAPAAPSSRATASTGEQTDRSSLDARYALDGSTVRLSWNAVTGADYYRVYHDDFFDSACLLRRDGTPAFCELLASRVVETTYIHRIPESSTNYYWVVACNSSGCSDIASDSPARPLGDEPTRPENVRHTIDGSTVRLVWDAAPGADYYRVYHDDFFDSACLLRRDGTPAFCELLASRVVGTTYVHRSPERSTNYYWVVACNSSGCSDINPRTAGPAEPPDAESSTDASAAASRRDREALVALYESTDGENWQQNRNWLSDAPLSDWHGVSTDGDGRVVALELSGNNLVGTLPPELSTLTRLALLDVSANHLRGVIPSGLASLASLRVLLLNGNELTGRVPPELGGLSSLVILALHHNLLRGEVPEQLGDLANLLALSVWEGNQLAGAIPEVLAHALVGPAGLLTALGDFASRLGVLAEELGTSIEELGCAFGELGCALGGIAGAVGTVAGVVGTVIGGVFGVVGSILGSIFG